MSSQGRIVVVGAGGNIGSHLVPHLGRLSGLTSVHLIDKDFYEPKNLCSQAITPNDVGRAKASVQARRLRRIAPHLSVEATVNAVENLPLGRLRADALISCVDSRAARQYLNESCWRLANPWIDGGVEASSRLARVNVWVPAAEAPCAECHWTGEDYAALPQRYECFGGAPASVGETSPTDAPSSLGALVAALQASELEKLVAGDHARLAIHREVMIDLASHRHYVTRFERSAACRFDHAPPGVARLAASSASLSLEEACALPGRAAALSASDRATVDATPGVAIGVDGQRFVASLCCKAGHRNDVCRLETRLRPRDLRCRRCGAALAPDPFELADRLLLTELSPRLRRRRLTQIGLRPADVFRIDRWSGTADRFELVASSNGGTKEGTPWIFPCP